MPAASRINNLLTIIQLCGNYITEDADDPVLVREEIEKCLDASRRGEALVRDLLAVARKQILKPRSVSVTDALRQSIGLLTRLLGTDIEIEADLPEEPLTVEIDPDKLSQIVMNLSVNARDAMPQGGTLTVAAWREVALPGTATAIRLSWRYGIQGSACPPAFSTARSTLLHDRDRTRGPDSDWLWSPAS